MPRMLADKKRTLWVLDEWPEDVDNVDAVTLNEAENASCVVGNSGFTLGAGSPNTENDGALCEGDSAETPTSQTYEASMNVFRFYDHDTGQIIVEEDFLFQALKEFGSTVVLALRDGGKEHDKEAEDGDEVSFYEVTSGGMGRPTDTTGWQKREAHLTVNRAAEDKWVGGVAPDEGS